MKLAMIGLGRMGANMVRRLVAGGHACVVYDPSAEARAAIAGAGVVAVDSLSALVAALEPPRVAWVMVPAGEATEKTVQELGARLSPGDVIVDGGNSFFKDDVRRATAVGERGIHYVDVGTSGGIWGVERGYCLMIGGPKAAIAHLVPVFETLAPGRGTIPVTPRRAGNEGPDTAERGWLHCGNVGAGHFVKMIHNGIEYGLMQAYAEGFDILEHADSEALPEEHRYDLDLGAIAEVWRRGSVVSSWLLDLTAIALAESPRLDEFDGYVADSGEGRWTVNAAIDEAVPAEVLSAALYARFRSRAPHAFSNRLLSAMRKQFGGHVEPRH